MNHTLSTNLLMLGLSLGAVVCFGAFVLYGAWIDGRREKLREQGFHPTTGRTGSVHTTEEESRSDGDERT